MKAKELIIYSDMDGTILTDWNLGPVVPEKNVSAIKDFINEGGLFGIASGRSCSNIETFFKEDILNAPIIGSNGSMIYDPIKKNVIRLIPVDLQVKKDVIEFVLEHKDINLIASYNGESCYVDLGDARKKIDPYKRTFINVDIFFNNDITKFLFASGTTKRMEQLITDFEKIHSIGLVSYALSSPCYLECYNKLVDKGKSVRFSCEYLKVTDRTLVCIGDFYNDMSMLKNCDIVACPENAVEDIKKISSIITVNNNEGSIADLIYKLKGL